jgi:hypothetical protein
MKIISITGNKLLLTLLLFIASSVVLIAQDSKETVALKDLVASRRYIFNAESVLPLNGRLRLLNSGERVELNGDTLITDLPYFGRAYSASIDASQGGFHFTSTDFEYTIKDKKKGGWSILLKPKDSRNVQQLILDISSTGMASLQVVSNNRQAISFNGHIIETKKK